jgi:mono/diheme cytochrome c family protein
LRRILALSFLVLILSGCDKRVPAPAYPTAASITVGALKGDVQAGALLWREKQCAACHGANGAGGMGGALAGTALPFDRFLVQVRNALPPKPAMSAADLSDTDAYSIFLWLQTVAPARANATPVPAPLPAGQIFGILVWSERGCAQCHGAFAQGSDKAPALAGESFPFERQRAVMRLSSDQNPAHSEKNIPDDILQRLLNWLRQGADPSSGC